MAEKKQNSTEKATSKTTEKKTVSKPAAEKAEVKQPAKKVEKPVAEKKTAAKPAEVKAEAKKSVVKAEKSAPVKQTATAKPAKLNTEKPATKAVKPATKAEPQESAATKTAEAAEKPVKRRKAEAEAPVAEESYIAATEVITPDGGVAVSKTKERIKFVAIIAAALLFVVSLALGLVLGLKSCQQTVNGIYMSTYSEFVNVGVTQVGHSSQVLGKANRVKPVAEIKNDGARFGNTDYPKYGYTLRDVIGVDDDKVAARQALIAESAYLCTESTSANSGASPSPYYFIDKDGWLKTRAGEPSLDENGNPRRLYQHTAAVGLYEGDVSDSEPGVVKKLTYSPRSYSSYYDVTGLYAPAGEVIKVEMSKTDFEATGGIVIHIGQALYNGQANNIWTAKNQMQRMPVILNTLVLDANSMTFDEATQTYVGYIGSFLGGPIYVRDERVTFSVTISGAVNYSHFILGVTTEKEFKENSKSSAPYFDLEVWDRGVLHSGPKKYAKNFNYKQLYNAAALWEKVSLVSSQRVNQGVVFIYDPFVAAGAAVAFPGRRSVNCPAGWMSGSLNYESFVTSGAWGNMHEYNHNFQGFGCHGGDGEITNNSLNLVEYSLFTKVSSARQISGYGGAGLSGWNQYTSATWALERVNEKQIASTNGLALYSTLLHNFGQDAFIKSSKGRAGAYFINWGNVTHHNMSYYISMLDGYISGDYSQVAPAQKDYPMFVPVSSVYQTGRSYNYDGEKRYIKTMQPYVIPYGEDFTVDLSKYTVNAAGQYVSGSVVLGGGQETDASGNRYSGDFDYRIKNVEAGGINGTFTKVSDYVYNFKPNSELNSGKIYVTLEITKKDGSFKVDDVDLVLEFQQSRETKKNVLERTTYTYAEGSCYTSATEAYESNYKGFINKEEKDNINAVQNSNTDVWYTKDNRAPKNSVVEVTGKLYFPEAGKYRIAFRGRWNVALYLSFDGGKTYELGAKIETTKTQAGFPLTEGTYIDKDLEAESWVYFKEVMICQSANVDSFVGLGLGQWTVPMYTTTVDEDGVTHYFDVNGKEVTPEQASNVEPIPPTRINYATAYRSNYEFAKQFTSEYFYKRSYSYNYTDNAMHSGQQTVVSTNYAAGNSWSYNNYPIENLTDGDKNTIIHTRNFGVSDDKALEFVIDMGETKPVNRMIIYTSYRPNGDYHCPKDFTLYGSLDGETYFDVADFTGAPRVGTSVTVNFEEKTFRYYKLVIHGSTGTHVIISEIEMWRVYELLGGTHKAFDGSEFKGKWQVASTGLYFGHTFVGATNATVNFEFEGNKFLLFSSDLFEGRFEVYVDGKKYESETLKEKTGHCSVSYISPTLSQGKHTVKIRCLGGKASFESAVFFNESD